MNEIQYHALALRETDIEGALKRLNGESALYVACLRLFLRDTTIAELNAALQAEDWDTAFNAAHALKGLAGNLGLVPLMHATGQLVVVIRGGRTREIGDYLQQVNSHYRDITDAIQHHFMTEEPDDAAL